MSYSCEYQNEIQSAPWSRESVMLFTAAMTYKAECKTFLIVSDSRDKGKDTVTVFIDFLYSHFGATDATEGIIWSDGPSSEFKNKYMVKFLQSLSQKYNQQFSWKYFAASHGKGIVDGVGGSAKSLVRSKVMSQGDDRIVVQSSWNFANAAQKLLHKTEVFHISQEEIIANLPDLVDWSFIDLTSLGLRENNIHIIKCCDGSTYKHAQDQKLKEITYGTQTNPLVNQMTKQCILFIIN